MKKLLLLLCVSLVWLLADSAELNVTGTRVSATCKKIAAQQTFQYYTWAEGCPAYSKAEAYSYLFIS